MVKVSGRAYIQKLLLLLSQLNIARPLCFSYYYHIELQLELEWQETQYQIRQIAQKRLGEDFF